VSGFDNCKVLRWNIKIVWGSQSRRTIGKNYISCFNWWMIKIKIIFFENSGWRGIIKPRINSQVNIRKVFFCLQNRWEMVRSVYVAFYMFTAHILKIRSWMPVVKWIMSNKSPKLEIVWKSINSIFLVTPRIKFSL